jgi:hypothetical protein
MHFLNQYPLLDMKTAGAFTAFAALREDASNVSAATSIKAMQSQPVIYGNMQSLAGALKLLMLLEPSRLLLKLESQW